MTTHRGAIVVFAKAPRPGEVKTRMCPPLTPEQACGLYACLLADVLAETAVAARRNDLAPFVAVHPAKACGEIARAAPPGFTVVPQRGRNLSQRMAWAVAERAASGAPRVLLRGSDSPLLDTDVVARALATLDEVDLVLCPDRDGGYNLVGLRRPAPGLFEHPMSTGSVLDDTLENAAALGLCARRQDAGFDLDRFGDLALLAAARSEGRAKVCAKTIAYLDHEALWPASEQPEGRNR